MSSATTLGEARQQEDENSAFLIAETPQVLVGEFFEHLVAEIFDGRITSPDEWDLGDVFVEDIDTAIEVKARDRRPFILNRKQKDHHVRKAAAKEVSDFLYGFCCYGSRKRFDKDDPRRLGYSEKSTTFSMLAQLETEEEKRTHLSQHIERLYLLDIRMVDAWGKHNGYRLGGYIGEVRKKQSHFNLGRRDLNWIFTHPAESIALLGLRGKWKFGVQDTLATVYMDGGMYSTRFMLHTALRPATHEAVYGIVGRRMYDPDLPF